MKVTDLYSKRQKRLRGEVPDVYIYDEIPKEFRVQVIHIWNDAFGGPKTNTLAKQAFMRMEKFLCREYGVFSLVGWEDIKGYISVEQFFITSNNVDRVLDVIEVSFKTIQQGVFLHRTMDSVDAIKELNLRFREHGLGYQFESGELIRVDSQFIHAEAVKPALGLLSDRNYEGANEEFLTAHEHYRHGRYKECLNDCLKAFESTMKAICDKRGWSYNPTDAANKLIDVCFNNGLIPSYLQSEFSALKTSLVSGVPTVRNKMGGHGQGAQPVAVPRYLASYLLNLTASNIVLLVEAEKELP